MDSFYEKKIILITGSTGFVGLVLLKTILSKLASVSKIILPVRKTANIDPQIKNDPRIHLISGFDLSKKGLGLAKESLLKTVNIVFHSAAIVQWNVPFHQHIQVNALATLELLDLCKSPCLELFVHFSTTAVGSIPSPFNIFNPSTKLMKEDIDKTAVQLALGKIQKEQDPNFDGSSLFPGSEEKTLGRNYYCYSKLLLEHLLYSKSSHDVPILIVRLCSIDPSFEFPKPGFGHKYHGAGVFTLKAGITIGKGRILPDHDIQPINSWPVDLCVHSILAHTAYHSRLTQGSSSNFRVINMSSNQRNPVSLLDRFEASSHIVGPITRMPVKEATTVLLKRAQNGDIQAKTNLTILRWYVNIVKISYHDENMRSVLDLLSLDEGKRFKSDITLVHWPTLLKNAADEYYYLHSTSKL